MWNDSYSERKSIVNFRKNNAEIVANCLIMEGVKVDSPQYEARIKEVWKQTYPDVSVPSAGVFLSALWASTRTVLEKASVRLVSRHMQQAFVCERFIHFHSIRLSPDIRMEELRRAVEADMSKVGLEGFDDGKALLAYTSRRDPERADPGKTSFSQEEADLIVAMYQWLFEQYGHKPLTFSASPVENKPVNREIIAKAVKPEALPISSGNLATERVEGRRRRSGYGRSRSPEELEMRTLARIKGQLAIDLLLMNGEAGINVDSDEDIEVSERLQFISACQVCTELPDEYRDEQNIIKMWEVISQQDKMLFTAGSLTELLDSRFTIITCRCLLKAIACADDTVVSSKAAILASAFELCEAFQLDSSPDSVRKLLERNIYRYYTIGNRIPESAVDLLRARADDICDAYNMYLEQILEEQKQREIEFNARLADQRKFDQFHQQVAQRANIVELIKKFTVIENGAALGWLCMAVNGADYTKEKLCYYIENLMQQLESVELKPVGTDKVACVFDGGSDGTEAFVDMSGHALEAGEKYRMAQLGWMFDGEIVVYPMAERV